MQPPSRRVGVARGASWGASSVRPGHPSQFDLHPIIDEGRLGVQCLGYGCPRCRDLPFLSLRDLERQTLMLLGQFSLEPIQPAFGPDPIIGPRGRPASPRRPGSARLEIGDGDPERTLPECRRGCPLKRYVSTFLRFPFIGCRSATPHCYCQPDKDRSTQPNPQP